MPRVYGAALEKIQRDYSGYVREEEAVVTAGTTATLIAARDPERVSLTLINLDAAEVLIAPTPSVGLNRGIRLAPEGGGLSVNVSEDAILPAVEWWAISLAGGAPVYRLVVRREVVVEVEPRR